MMTANNSPHSRNGKALTARRSTLLASVAGIGAAVLLAGPGYAPAFLGFGGSSASAAEAVSQPIAHPQGFADLVSKVKPAVISVRVKIPASAEPAMSQEDGDDQQQIPAQPGSPLDKFFQQFGGQFGQQYGHQGRGHSHEMITGEGSGSSPSAVGTASPKSPASINPKASRIQL